MIMQPLINGTRFTNFAMKLLSYEVGACSFKDRYITTPNSIFPADLESDYGLRKIRLVVDFDSTVQSGQPLIEKISMVTSILKSRTDIFLPDGYHYLCYLDSISAPKEVAPWIYQVTIELSGLRCDAKKTETMSSSNSIYNFGTLKSPAIVKVSSSASTVRVMGITIVNMENGQITIDGISKKVTRIINGQETNAFLDTDLTVFPALEPGENNVDIDIEQGETATVELEYYPIYL